LKKKPTIASSAKPSFAMICCQNGAQSAVLAEVVRDGWKLAFSRPGFVTVKQEASTKHLPRGVFVRTASWSLGKTSGSDSSAMIADISRILSESGLSFDRLHVWPRDRVPIGKFGFEPGLDEVSRVIADAIAAGLPQTQVTNPTPNQIAKAGERVLDIVIVDPSEWWIGWHEVPKAVANLPSSHLLPTTWPGGVQPITPTVPVISRAYYKAAEAIAWSGLDIKSGDLAVEVGSAPGGACGRLLELGLRVIGIDPGEMDPVIADHPRFKHIRARAGDIPRREFRNAKWLFVDSNVRPDQSLTTVENIINHRESSIEGMILTLKLGGFEHADRIAGWIQRIKTWGSLDIRVRNLARSKVEVCMVVQGSKRS
jgi:23S rRNA (cytidine2498-2'-O)-methyltransferase